MDAVTGYGYILPELTTEEYFLLMFTLNQCKDGIPYGFKIRPLIGKIQAGAMVAVSDPAGKGSGNEPKR